MKYKIYITIVLVMFIKNFAQININNVFIKAGLVKNYQEDRTFVNLTEFYGEFGFGGNLIGDRIRWSLLAGYFNEELKDNRTVTYNILVLHKNWNLGIRTHFIVWRNNNLGFIITGGVNYNLREKRINRENIYKSIINDNFWQPYLGFELNYKLTDNFKILIEVGSNIGVKKDELGRYLLVAGIKYILNK